MNGKKNWMQAVTLALCALLLGLTLWQNRRIADLEQEIWAVRSNAEQNYQSIRGDFYQLSSELEEMNKHVRTWELRPAGIDRSGLLAELSLTLKEWSEDTEVQVTVSRGDSRQNLPLSSHGDGTFSASALFPLETGESGEEIQLAAAIRQDGTSFQEQLGGWEDISMLLPVQIDSWGGGHPLYQDGVLSASSWPDAHFRGPNGGPAEVSDTELRLYRNDRLELTRPAVYDPETGNCASVLEGGEDPWQVECRDGDTVRVDLFCRDQYGLGYTFTLSGWEIGSGQDYVTGVNHGGAIGVVGPYASPVLSWD